MKKPEKVLEKYRDIICAVFLYSLTAFYFFFSFKIKDSGKLFYGGSRLMPWFASGVLFIVSTVVLVKGIRKVYAEEKKDVELKPRHFTKVLGIFLIFAVYVFFLSRLGFLISTLVFLFVMISYISNKEQRVWWKIAIISVISTLAIWLFFSKAFKLLLPTGMWLR